MIEWRTVPGWPKYEVSEYGDVRRAYAHRKYAKHSLLVQEIRSGYPSVTFCLDDGKSSYKKISTHRVVAMAFLGAAPSLKHQVAHNDGRRLNCHYSNLRWATASENERDKILHGTKTSKLSMSQVTDIRTKFSNERRVDLAKKYDVSVDTIYDVLERKTWR